MSFTPRNHLVLSSVALLAFAAWVPAHADNPLPTSDSCNETVIDSGAQEQPAAAKPAETKPEPFACAAFTWLNGNSRQHKPTFDYPAFTGEIRVDTNYVYDLNHPKDHT